MNEFDFQSGDFLDSLFTNAYSGSSDVTGSHSVIDDTSTIQGQKTESHNTGGFAFQDSTKNEQNLYTNNTNQQEESAKSQSFPPNFYKEIDYNTYDPSEERASANRSHSTNGENDQNQIADKPCQQTDGSSQNSTENTDAQESSYQIDIVINNVVSSFAVGCHLNLRRVATETANAIYKRESGMVSMKIRKPYTTASIWSSGKLTCTGATSEDEAKTAARRYSRILQKMGYRVHFKKFRVVNVLGTSSFPFGIKITSFSRDNREASYEPELHPGVTFRMKEPKATLKIFSTGSITVTAPSVFNVQMAIQKIYPLVEKYRVERNVGSQVECGKLHLMPSNRGRRHVMQYNSTHGHTDSNNMDTSDDDDFDSDDSHE